MSYTANEQFASANGKGSGLRCFPSSVQPKTFAQGSGTLAALTPVAYNTSTNFWVPFVSGGSNGTGTIRGFVWPDGVVLAAGNEVIGNVLMGGRVHFDDIPATGAGYTNNQLKAELQANTRDLGFIIEGLASFR